MNLHPITVALVIIECLLAFVIIFCVAAQQTKSEGLSGTIGGGSSSSFRGSRQDEFLARITRYASITWIIVCVFLAYCWEHFRV